MARKNLYPPSVTPGIPKLDQKPAGWVETTLGDVLQVVQRRVKMNDDTEYQLVTAKRGRGGIVPRSVLKGREILTKTQFYIKSGDFLISRRQIIHGACGVVPPTLDGAIVSNEYSTLRKEGLLLEFLQYYCYTTFFQQTCFQASVGVDVEKMIFNLNDWLKYKVYLPPVPEQHEIAEILCTWDEAICLTERLIAIKQRRKKALMEQLLTGRRFREFVQSEARQQTRFGEMPADWDIVHIEDTARVNIETLSENSASDHLYYYIDLSSVDKGSITFPKECQCFSELPSRARRVLHKGDIIMATVRPYLLGFAVCDFEPTNVLCSTGFALISPKIASDSNFIYQSLYGSTILEQIQALLTGSNYPAINSSDVKKLVSTHQAKAERVCPSKAEWRQRPILPSGRRYQ